MKTKQNNKYSQRDDTYYLMTHLLDIMMMSRMMKMGNTKSIKMKDKEKKKIMKTKVKDLVN
jgi:hypothetical protein